MLLTNDLPPPPPPPLRSVLCLEDRCALGRVEEVFGPVMQPIYALRYAWRGSTSSSSGGASGMPATVVKGATVFSVQRMSAFIMPDDLVRACVCVWGGGGQGGHRVQRAAHVGIHHGGVGGGGGVIMLDDEVMMVMIWCADDLVCGVGERGVKGGAQTCSCVWRADLSRAAAACVCVCVCRWSMRTQYVRRAWTWWWRLEAMKR